MDDVSAGEAPPTHAPTAFDLLSDYRPIAGAYDECLDEEGTVRLAYRELIDKWAALGDQTLQTRRQTADRYLKDNGVAHRVYGDGQSEERPWPLSDVPLVLSGDEWASLEQGLIQRAHLLESVVSDVYGAQSLTQDGHLPASLVASAPGFLRPLVGVQPKSGHHLHFIAIELGRGPDGRWWVLGDRTQAPSGVGYALENRLAMNRSSGSDLRDLNITRLAAFFRTFRQTISELRADHVSTRVGLLTPGPFNETYYEQALLARYLGLLLLEGGDLTVRDGKLYIRTVRGLQEIDVLWRRLDANFCDPLELNPSSQLGVPGLVEALRAGKINCVNSLGSGILETRGFMAFFPQLCQHLLGETLALPNIATWWHGDTTMREAAENAAGSTIQLSAFGTSLPMDGGQQFRASDQPSGAINTVTQESVRLSTMPVLEIEAHQLRLAPHPFTLRVFLAREGNDWTVMPGGFCRVSDGRDTRALSMQDGSRSCDVWVRSTNPNRLKGKQDTNIQQAVRRVPGTLPARAADNLFWLGRYAERAQLTMRLCQAYLDRRGERSIEDDALLQPLRDQLGRWGVDDPADTDMFAIALLPTLQLADSAASAIRDRLSPDAWRVLNGFVSSADTQAFKRLSSMEQINDALTMLATFAGLANENMMRLMGWRFMEIGRRLERALGTLQASLALGMATTDKGKPNSTQQSGQGEILLELADSTMTYRQRYAFGLSRQTLLDLVLLDPNNPRSVVFQLERLHQHLNEISDHPAFDQPSNLQRSAFKLWSQFAGDEANDINEEKLVWAQEELLNLSMEISQHVIRPDERHSPLGL